MARTKRNTTTVPPGGEAYTGETTVLNPETLERHHNHARQVRVSRARGTPTSHTHTKVERGGGCAFPLIVALVAVAIVVILVWGGDSHSSYSGGGYVPQTQQGHFPPPLSQPHDWPSP